jgi:DNA-directed RNA polymerase subunit beta
LRALGYSNPEILELFFDSNVVHFTKKGPELDLVPERLRGETALFEITAGGKVIVEEGRRITARHVRQLEEAGIKRLAVPVEYLESRILAHDVVDKETGEVLATANDVLNAALVERFLKAGITEIGTLYVNDLDRGPYVSDTLRIDATTTASSADRIYR